MARGVISQFPRPACTHVSDTQFIDQVFAKFEAARCQRLGTRQPHRIVSEEFQVPVPDHRAARPRWDHEWLGRPLKRADGVLRHIPCLGPHPRVERRLSAASLLFKKCHLNAGVIQHINNRLPNLGLQRIDQASGK